MTRFRIREAATTRTHGGEWTADIRPSDDVNCAQLLTRKATELRLNDPRGYVLEAWLPRKGWTQVAAISG